MTDYNKLVKALRYCSTTKGMVYCNVNCKYGLEERSKGCKDLLMNDAADSIEALQAQMPKRGEWIHIEGDDPWEWTCSVCMKKSEIHGEEPAFCPNCGADMRKMEETEDEVHSCI